GRGQEGQKGGEGMSTFREWFKENLGDSAHDIAAHGADAGYPHITYTSDTVALFNQFGDEIWEMAVEDAGAMGDRNVAEVVVHFNRGDMVDSLGTFKNRRGGYACERVARETEEEVA